MNSTQQYRTVSVMLCFVFLVNGAASTFGASPESAVPAMPMAWNEVDGIRHRWEQKPVLAARSLDAMEDLARWRHRGFGSMALSKTKVHQGTYSLLLVSPTKAAEPGPVKGRPFGAASVVREFDRENWTDFNRLSFHVYPDLPGFRVVSMCAILHNDGAEKVPGPYGRNGLNFILLKNHQWNHCFWEIPHLGRDAVTGIEFQYRLQGNEPGATREVRFYFDQLELQRVDPDYFEGWGVAPGRIAFSHPGYRPGGAKRALASGLEANEFEVIEADSGEVVFRAPVRTETFATGTFQVLDFSELEAPGRFALRAGGMESRPFRITRDIWRESLVKTINFFYSERCGDAVPGVHDICHRDWICAHEDRQLPVHGGWHDAGDLSQGLVNTAEAAYAMYVLAEKRSDSDPALAERLIEEAGWGLDWILKTRFGDGFRCTWATMDFWTDGILGTVDDVVAEARNRAFENFLAAATEACAARMLSDRDPIRARYALEAAEADWGFALERHRPDHLETVAAGVNAALDLYLATGATNYAKVAGEMADTILACQQQTPTDWDFPMRGFFYTGPDRRRILHYAHRGHEQAPVIGLVRLCRLFPKDDRASQWRAAVVRYAQYYKTLSRYTHPWGMIPAGIYARDESSRETYDEQVENGIRLSETYFLRRFPVWYDFRGNHGTTLSQAAGLAAAATLLDDLELREVVERQLKWVVGQNPFCQSTMWGEGYDFAPQYTAMSGDLVGSLPVGVQTHFTRDQPYWPAENCYNWKEVWVHPSARWMLIMKFLEPAARER